MHRAGYAAIVGRPSAGKSTLLNRLLGQKLSIVSPKPQTTRHKLLGLLNGEDWQLVFVDTPGWLEKAQDKLQDALRRSASTAAREEADVVVWAAEGEPTPDELASAAALGRAGKRLVLALTKADLPAAKERHDKAEAAFAGAAAWDGVFRVSGLHGQGVGALRDKLVALLPESPPYYPKDQLSDRWDRFFAAERIREQVFALYGEEVPHAVAVVIEDYRETPKGDRIAALLVVEREGQKAIVVGKGGRMIGRLREAAQKEIAAFTGRPAELELWVKVRKDWRKDPKAVAEFGY